MSYKKSSMYSKGVDFAPPVVPSVGSQVTTQPNKIISNLSKWIPLICAGTAVGVSIIALKEIKNVRKELFILKKESNSVKGTEILEKMESMDEQIRKITAYLANQNNFQNVPVNVNNKQDSSMRNKGGKSKNPAKKDLNKVNIINEEPPVEYEEVEVTDDDEEVEEEETEE